MPWGGRTVVSPWKCWCWWGGAGGPGRLWCGAGHAGSGLRALGACPHPEGCWVIRDWGAAPGPRPTRSQCKAGGGSPRCREAGPCQSLETHRRPSLRRESLKKTQSAGVVKQRETNLSWFQCCVGSGVTDLCVHSTRTCVCEHMCYTNCVHVAPQHVLHKHPLHPGLGVITELPP